MAVALLGLIKSLVSYYWSKCIVITCLTSSYIYASEDFGQTKFKRIIVNGEVKMARRVMLSSGKSCVQYIIDTN